MAFTDKKFLNSQGVTYLWQKIEQKVKDTNDALEAKVTKNANDISAMDTAYKAADTAINNKIGTVDTGHTVMGDIAALDTAYKAADADLASDIADNAAAIELLNKTDGTVGSVKKTVDDAIAAVVASAPEDFDTLKEMSDWISGHETDAAAMNSAIQANATAIGTASVEGGAAATGLHKKIEDETARATTAEGGLASRIQTLEGLAGNTSVADQITAAINNLDADLDAATNASITDAEKVAVVTGVTEVNGVLTAVDSIDVDKAGAASRAKAAVIGASTDASSANTIYAAKKYTDEAYAAVIALTNDEIDAAITAANNSQGA